MDTVSFPNYAKFALLAALGATILIATPSHAAETKQTEVKAACRIEVDNAHSSTSLVRHRKQRYIKVNARSICNVPQRQVTLTLEIYKIGFFGDRFIARFETRGVAQQSNSLKIEIKTAPVRCKNIKKTFYFGVAHAKAIIGGEWQYAGNTRSKSIALLNCGTRDKLQLWGFTISQTNPSLRVSRIKLS